jgi:hypothetical protein
MAIPENRKKRRADEVAQDNRSPKRLRSDQANQGDHIAKRKRPHDDKPLRVVKKIRSTSDHNISPSFFDNLSKVSLTQRALRELDRRNNTCPPSRFTEPDVVHKDLAWFAKHVHKDLARFARHGGPDIGHLRGVCSHSTPLR